MGVLDGKTIVFGVTGGIAAYKSCEAVSRLKKLGAEVDVIMTKNATQFLAPLTFETLSARPVTTPSRKDPMMLMSGMENHWTEGSSMSRMSSRAAVPITPPANTSHR